MRCELDRSKYRLAGVAGLAGALLFFTGDMLFYGYFGDGASFANGMVATVSRASIGRLYAGGLVGPLAACFCMVGFWHVCMNVRRSNATLAYFIYVLFILLMVAGSAVHTLWTAKGLALKYCSNQSGPCSSLLAAIKSYWLLAYNIGAVPGYLDSGRKSRSANAALATRSPGPIASRFSSGRRFY